MPLILLSRLLTRVAKLKLITLGNRLPTRLATILFRPAGPRDPFLCLIHLWDRTASIAVVQAEGWLTLSLLTVPTRAVLPHCVGGRAKRRPLVRLW